MPLRLHRAHSWGKSQWLLRSDGRRFGASRFHFPNQDQNGRNGQSNNLEIEPEGFMLHIIKIQIDLFLEGRFVLATDLPQTRQARRGFATAFVAREEQFEFIRRAGPGANQTHFTAQNVDQLRQFIRAKRPENQTTENKPLVTAAVQFLGGVVGGYQVLEMGLMHGGVRIDLHGAELQTHEAFPESADALLTEKGGAGRNQFDKEGDEHAQGHKHGKGQQDAGDIKDPFP